MPAYAFGTKPDRSEDLDRDPGEQPQGDGDRGPVSGDEPAHPGTTEPAASSPSSTPDPESAAKAAERERKRRLKQERLARLAAGREKARARKEAARGATPAAAKANAAQATIDLTSILYSLHTMGAVLLKAPGLAITEDEAKMLASAAARVSEQYDVPLLDEKTRAWLNLAMAATQVYGTRIVAVVVEKKKKAPAPPPMVLTPFRTPPPPPQSAPVMEGHNGYTPEASEA